MLRIFKTLLKFHIAGYSADEKVTKCHVRGEVSLEGCGEYQDNLIDLSRDGAAW